jgi:membrane protein required for colicin V production
MPWNWLDIVLIVVAAVSCGVGIAKGFARVGVGLAAAIAGLLLGIWFFGTVAYYLLPYVSSKAIAGFIGFWVVFILSLIAGGLLGKLLALLFKWAGLTWMDRLLGGVFGLVRGLILCIAIVLVLIAFAPKPPPRSVVGSRWAPYLVGAANVLAGIAPRELKDAFVDSYEKVRELWREALKKKRDRLPETEV